MRDLEGRRNPPDHLVHLPTRSSPKRGWWIIFICTVTEGVWGNCRAFEIESVKLSDSFNWLSAPTRRYAPHLACSLRGH